MAQIHYVVVYDTEQKEFYPDIDTEISRFPDGSVFVEDSEIYYESSW